MSIFTDMSVQRLEDAAHTHVFNAAAGVTGSSTHIGSYHVIAAGSYLSDDSTATFAVAMQSGSLLVIKFAPFGSQGTAT